MIIDLIEIIMDVRYIISFVLCFENEFNILFWNIYIDWGICLKILVYLKKMDILFFEFWCCFIN